MVFQQRRGHCKQYNWRQKIKRQIGKIELNTLYK